MNKISLSHRHLNPKKLLLGKWTAATPKHKEKHFLVIKLIEPELPDTLLEYIELEAVYSGRTQVLPWKELTDAGQWLQGWLYTRRLLLDIPVSLVKSTLDNQGVNLHESSFNKRYGVINDVHNGVRRIMSRTIELPGARVTFRCHSGFLLGV